MVTYQYFYDHFWGNMSKDVRTLEANLVWTEFHTRIRGICDRDRVKALHEAVQLCGRKAEAMWMSRQEYCQQVHFDAEMHFHAYHTSPHHTTLHHTTPLSMAEQKDSYSAHHRNRLRTLQQWFVEPRHPPLPENLKKVGFKWGGSGGGGRAQNSLGDVSIGQNNDFTRGFN